MVSLAQRLALLLFCLAITACGTVRLVPTEPPRLERLGESVVRYAGPEVWAVVEHQFAAMSLGEEWLMLDVAVSGSDGRSARIEREKVFIRTPEGRRIRLASQEDFALAYPSLRGALARANVVRDPSYFFPSTRRPCAFGFFAVPGRRVTFDRVTVNDRRVCYERFFFAVPGGIQPGRWVLGIDLEESRVRVPIELLAVDP